MRPERILINGRCDAAIAPNDRSVHYGDGLFETVAVDHGKPLCLEQHLERLTLGCERLDIPIPDSISLRAEIMAMAENQSQAVVKVLVSRGTGGRGYKPPEPASPTRIVFRYPWQADTQRLRETGVATCICSGRLAGNPRLAGIKHLNRLEQVLASIEYLKQECDEGLMLDHTGHLIEGTMSNVFLVNDSSLVTPEIAECGVAGIMRQAIIDLVRSQNIIPLRIAPVPVDQVMSAKEVFLTNSTWGIWPVVVLERRRLKVGKVTRTLQTALARLGVIAATG